MRARNIKPGFFENECLAEVSPHARLLFIGLWMLADCNGNLEYRPKKIRAKIFPYESCINIIQKITELSQEIQGKPGVIRFYIEDGEIFINIPKFLKHQHPHKKERESGGKCPEPASFVVAQEILGKDGNFPVENGTDPAESLILNPELIPPYNIPPKGDSVSMKSGSEGSKPQTTYERLTEKQRALIDKIMEMYNSITGQSRQATTEDTCSKLVALIKKRQLIHHELGESNEALLALFRGIIMMKTEQWSGTDSERFIQPSTIFQFKKFQKYAEELDQYEKKRAARQNTRPEFVC